MANRFEFIKYDDMSAETIKDFKSVFMVIDGLFDRRLVNGGAARAMALAKLEESFMWISKAVRDEQLAREVLSDDIMDPIEG